MYNSVNGMAPEYRFVQRSHTLTYIRVNAGCPARALYYFVKKKASIRGCTTELSLNISLSEEF